MKKLFIIVFYAITFSSLGQNSSEEKIKIDKTKIAFINYNKSWDYPFNDVKSAELSEIELQQVEKLLLKCVAESKRTEPLKKLLQTICCCEK